VQSSKWVSKKSPRPKKYTKFGQMWADVNLLLLSKSKIKIHWWTKMNVPSHILQLSLLFWYTMLLTAVFCFIRSIRAIRGTITTPSWWNAVRVVALKLIRTTKVCCKSTQNKTLLISNIITQINFACVLWKW
jgi:hypothetical protein